MKSFMFVAILALVALSATNVLAQQSASVEYMATTFATPLSIAVDGDVNYVNLRPGLCYTTFAEEAATGTVPTNISPYDYTAAEEFHPGILTLAGGPSAEVAISLLLPTRLYPNGGGAGYVDISYDVHSAGVLDATLGYVTEWFNPTGGFTKRLDGAGAAQFNLGGNACVSRDAVDGGSGFTAEALVTVEYTGN